MSLREESSSSLWNLRLAPETKALWAAAAEAKGVSLSEYVRSIVTERALARQDATAESEEEMAATGTETELQVEMLDAPEEAQLEEGEVEVDTSEPWEGVLGTIGSPTSDGRYPVPDEVTHRDLPVEFHMQPALAEGHEGAVPVGCIEEIEYIPFVEFARASEFYSTDQLSKMPEHAVVIWGRGVLNGDHAEEAARRIDNGADVSLDGLRFNGLLYSADTYEQLSEQDLAGLEMGDVFEGIMKGTYLQGLEGKIAGATLVSSGAFEEARVVVTASGSLRMAASDDVAKRFAVLIAAAGPLKPPREWFEDPGLRELTPLQIGKDGRVVGHLADWNGCHTGFQGVCVPPFHSLSEYGFFNVGEIETAEGNLVPCGKLMFSMEGKGHASTSPLLSYQDIQRYYDDATKVGAFVRAGSDRFGTWLAGALRSGLSEIEIQHLRTHPPSGDWRPIRGGDSDLVAAFSVPVPGFPIPRGEALVASAGGDITAIITAPLDVEATVEHNNRLRRRQVRLQTIMGTGEKSRAEIRQEISERLAHGPWGDGLDGDLAIDADQRRQWAKEGIALADGSFPITKCSGDGASAENAIRARERGGPSAARTRQIESHIRSRVKALGGGGDSEMVKSFLGE